LATLLTTLLTWTLLTLLSLASEIMVANMTVTRGHAGLLTVDVRVILAHLLKLWSIGEAANGFWAVHWLASEITVANMALFWMSHARLGAVDLRILLAEWLVIWVVGEASSGSLAVHWWWTLLLTLTWTVLDQLWCTLLA